MPENSKLHYCKSRYQALRRVSRVINIGEVKLGGDNPIRVQSMTTTNTQDVEATVKQSLALAEAGCGDAAIAGGVNRRAAGRCVVDAAVGAGDLMNRVQSFQVEVGADAGEVQRCPQKGLAHANAVGAVVADVTIGIFVAVGLMVIATVGVLGGQNFPSTQFFTVQP